MLDLAPTIYRQRLVVEGYPQKTIDAAQIKTYLSELSEILGMKTVLKPMTHRSDKYGEAGWIHWETSGAHFYAWDDPLFFSVDIYTCKKFTVESAISFTNEFFNCQRIEYREF